MDVGLFGKLPAKRDFIAYGVDRRILELIEPWLQSAIAGSRDQMGNDWMPAYMNAPIWRFWFGPQVCGARIAGALMPSVDGVGRCFPLAVIADGVEFGPPAVDPQPDWYLAVEHVLLGALDEGKAFDTTKAELARLPGLAPAAEPSSPQAAFGMLAHQAAPDLADAFTYWWTQPGPGLPVRAILRRGLPGPYDYLEMIRPVPVPEMPPEPAPAEAAAHAAAPQEGDLFAMDDEDDALMLTSPVEGEAQETAQEAEEEEEALVLSLPVAAAANGEDAEEAGAEETDETGEPEEAAADDAAAGETPGDARNEAGNGAAPAAGIWGMEAMDAPGGASAGNGSGPDGLDHGGGHAGDDAGHHTGGQAGNEQAEDAPDDRKPAAAAAEAEQDEEEELVLGPARMTRTDV